MCVYETCYYADFGMGMTYNIIIIYDIYFKHKQNYLAWYWITRNTIARWKIYAAVAAAAAAVVFFNKKIKC